MKNIHKLLFIFIIFTVLLVPSYSVKADPANNVITDEQITKIIEANESRKLSDNEIEIIKQYLEQNENSHNSGNIWNDTLKKTLKKILAKSEQYKEDVTDCNGVFGNPNNEDSTIYMIQRVLNYIKILAPLLVVLLSGFDFAKNTLSGDQDEMKKATKKLGIRLACAVGVYLAPLLTGFLINFINNSSIDPTCNIK